MQIVSNNLTFAYNSKAKFSRHALQGVTLTVNEGDFFGIIGETGSGKSTFIQHLNGLIPVQSGSLTVGEYNLSYQDKPRKEKKQILKSLKSLRYKVGMFFQYPEYQLFAETVFDDVAFGLKNFFPELSSNEVGERVKRAIELVGLDYNEVKDKSPFDLSGGQKRRVAIAGVLVVGPEILVLDEPVAGLDPIGKKMLMNLLHNLHDNGIIKTVIIVSHDMDEIAENCNKVAVFSEGKVLKTATPEELFLGREGCLSRLGKPTTATLIDRLKEVGVCLNGGFTSEDFVEQVTKEYLIKNNQKG